MEQKRDSSVSGDHLSPLRIRRICGSVARVIISTSTHPTAAAIPRSLRANPDKRQVLHDGQPAKPGAQTFEKEVRQLK